jgi:hypothetical protein
LTAGALTETTLPLHQQKPAPSLFLTTTTSVTSTTRKLSLFFSSLTDRHVDNDYRYSQHQKDTVYFLHSSKQAR